VDGCVELTQDKVQSVDGINEVNRMFRELYENAPGDGSSVRIYKGYGTPEGVVAAGIGSMYMRLDGSTGTAQYRKESGTGATGWVVTSNGGIQGPQGEKGDKGDTGDASTVPGPANSLSIGTVTQGTAAATITGTAPTQTLNLVLPKGDTGDKGDKGDKGDTGASGDNNGWTDATSYVHPTVTTANVIVGEGTAVGTNGTKVLALNVGGTPTTSPADMVQLYAKKIEVAASGGTVTVDGSYTVHKFTTSGTFTPVCSANFQVLVVAGGGGGSGFGGGGAGGVVYDPLLSLISQSYSVTVGNGGSGGNPGSNGQDSIFSSITAIGGGSGGIWRSSNGGDGANGGSGGGGGGSDSGTVGSGGSATSGQGYAGGNGATVPFQNGGGGGGGAGAVGQDAIQNVKGGNGGIGVSYSISGTETYYAGGGGGGTSTSVGVGGTGGQGGGANGSTEGGINATANTGGGGGGGGYNGDFNSGGNGGTGVVIIRYLTSDQTTTKLFVRDEAGTVTQLGS